MQGKLNGETKRRDRKMEKQIRKALGKLTKKTLIDNLMLHTEHARKQAQRIKDLEIRIEQQNDLVADLRQTAKSKECADIMALYFAKGK